jgi:hypothetical protein
MIFNIKTVEGICTVVLAVIAAVVMVGIMLCLFGCSWYDAKDSIAQGDTVVTKESSSIGFARTVTAPTHAASSIGKKTIEAGATDWENVSSNSGLYLLYWFGGIAILAGIAGGVFFKRYYLGASVSAAGLVLILVAQYTWILLVAAALGLAAGVWFVWDAANRAKVLAKFGLTSKTLKQTVDGIQDFKQDIPSEKDRINTALAANQDEDAKALVKAIK